ncbi:MAG: proton-conducting transporter membrane subunit [Gammaproteobacteria bacterium]
MNNILEWISANNTAATLLAFLVCGLLALACVFILGGKSQRRTFTALTLLQSLLLLIAGAAELSNAATVILPLWNFHSLGSLLFQYNPLSAIFLIVTAVVFAASLPFAAHDSAQYDSRVRRCLFLCLYELLYLSIVAVFISGDALSFLLAWEITALLIYGLVLFEHERSAPIRAAYLTLALSEFGSVAAIIGLLLLVGLTGHLDFAGIQALSGTLGEGARWIIFLLTFYGFGVKAGLVPVNLWLPDAHAAAPRTVSPVLSGATLNLGVYAIILVNTELLPVTLTGTGIVVLITGSVTAIIGILYAIAQHDMKRTLAHSSIENLGIVIAAYGAALVFGVLGHAVLAGMALIVALYHMINHSVYKTLLFIGSAAVDASTGTHDMDRLGGLIRRMPWTTLFFLGGIIAICALPPFNGFVSEWLTLQTLLRAAELASVPIKVTFAIAGALLALTAGLAITCFVMVFAMSFLGLTRSKEAMNAHEAPTVARVPMAALAVLCLALGILPTYVIPVLDIATAPLTHAHAIDTLVPPFFGADSHNTHGLSPTFVQDFHNLGAQVGQQVLPGRGLVVLHPGEARNPVVFAMSTAYTLPVLIILLLLVYLAFRLLTRTRCVSQRAVWAGGIRHFSPLTTYTATGFAAPVRVLFDTILHPITIEDATETHGEHFRTVIRRETIEFHIVDRLTLRPLIRLVLQVAALLRHMHHGRVNVYATYVLLSLLVVLIVGLWKP